MEKLKESETSLNAEAGDDQETLEKLLKSLGEDGPPEDQLQGLLENMMTQLMSKEVLYEPLKELNEKFPAYMKEKAATLKDEDRKRFEGQQVVVQQVVAIFEDPGYSPENVEQNVRVVTLMNEMQSYGSPPSEIMGPLPPGLELGQDGLPKLPDSCTIA
ncbi:hypothetical protein NM688_g9348 [Phlebia brevispora]|uniref:Uncharacterized protein n=1 Tax=Phlebia brevispora TaxID=194682 RepID=A0ACC1RK65_9APHY|nr:hypothetical protein NM688_g9348 [Phlebia brevispora]